SSYCTMQLTMVPENHLHLYFKKGRVDDDPNTVKTSYDNDFDCCILRWTKECNAMMKVKWILLLRRQEKKTTLVIKKHHVVLVIMALSNIPKVSKIKKRLKC
ncbi:hypothetical protein Lal_00020986, partial [Lupinus albus]